MNVESNEMNDVDVPKNVAVKYEKVTLVIYIFCLCLRWCLASRMMTLKNWRERIEFV